MGVNIFQENFFIRGCFGLGVYFISVFYKIVGQGGSIFFLFLVWFLILLFLVLLLVEFQGKGIVRIYRRKEERRVGMRFYFRFQEWILGRFLVLGLFGKVRDGFGFWIIGREMIISWECGIFVFSWLGKFKREKWVLKLL